MQGEVWKGAEAAESHDDIAYYPQAGGHGRNLLLSVGRPPIRTADLEKTRLGGLSPVV
jgi:hypothetical protein